MKSDKSMQEEQNGIYTVTRLQCQPEDLIEWKVDLNPELTYESRFKQFGDMSRGK